jgi:hypothetical protein
MPTLELMAELAEARADLSLARQAIEHHRRQAEALRESLDKYGRHLPSCWNVVDKGCGVCDCGLDAALAKEKACAAC